MYSADDTQFRCGHPLTKENTRPGNRRNDGSVAPQCRICYNAMRRRAERKKNTGTLVGRLRILLMTANRYVEGYAENENNHPQARECARDLVRQIKEELG